MQNIYHLVDEGNFRRDLFYRLNTIVIQIPPLQRRREDIPGLTEFFVSRYNLKYGKNIRFSDTAIAGLTKQDWPGNIRELKHTIEKTVILADSDIIDVIPFVETLRATSHGEIRHTTFCDKTLHATSLQSFHLEENERRIIQAALHHCSGKVSDAAQHLGINRSTLYEKIKKYSI